MSESSGPNTFDESKEDAKKDFACVVESKLFIVHFRGGNFAKGIIEL